MTAGVQTLLNTTLKKCCNHLFTKKLKIMQITKIKHNWRTLRSQVHLAAHAKMEFAAFTAHRGFLLTCKWKESTIGTSVSIPQNMNTETILNIKNWSSIENAFASRASVLIHRNWIKNMHSWKSLLCVWKEERRSSFERLQCEWMMTACPFWGKRFL